MPSLISLNLIAVLLLIVVTIEVKCSSRWLSIVISNLDSVSTMKFLLTAIHCVSMEISVKLCRVFETLPRKDKLRT